MLLTEYNEAEVMELFKEDGIKVGIDKHLISQICKKMKTGKPIETIADEVEETVESVTPIYNIAKKYAPDYDVDAIFKEFKAEKK